MAYQLDVFKEKENILIYMDGKIDLDVLDKVVNEIDDKKLNSRDLVEVVKKTGCPTYKTVIKDMMVEKIREWYETAPVHIGTSFRNT